MLSGQRRQRVIQEDILVLTIPPRLLLVQDEDPAGWVQNPDGCDLVIRLSEAPDAEHIGVQLENLRRVQLLGKASKVEAPLAYQALAVGVPA